MKDLASKILDSIGVITNEHRAMKLLEDAQNEGTTDSEGYDLDEDGNRLSCCGTPLDPDYMICSECREHC